MDSPWVTGSGVPLPSPAGHIHLISGFLQACCYNSVVEGWASIKLSLYTYYLRIKQLDGIPEKCGAKSLRNIKKRNVFTLKRCGKLCRWKANWNSSNGNRKKLNDHLKPSDLNVTTTSTVADKNVRPVWTDEGMAIRISAQNKPKWHIKHQVVAHGLYC